MVIISVVVCDKLGNLLLARTFQSITQLQLLEVKKNQVRNFPKLISATQQHTFIDHENFRYIYAPVDTIYIMLMTTRNSNIIEDLEVIRILNRVISEICVSISEESIKKNTFEILLAIDDVISSGNRESTSISQIQSALEMESSEEKLHNMLMKARENEAKEIAKKHQLEIEKKRQQELAQKSKAGKQATQPTQNAFTPQAPDPFEPPKPKVDNEEIQKYSSASEVITNKANVKAAPKKGMQLGKKKIDTNIFDQE